MLTSVERVADAPVRAMALSWAYLAAPPLMSAQSIRLCRSSVFRVDHWGPQKRPIISSLPRTLSSFFLLEPFPFRSFRSAKQKRIGSSAPRFCPMDGARRLSRRGSATPVLAEPPRHCLVLRQYSPKWYASSTELSPGCPLGDSLGTSLKLHRSLT